MANQNSVHPVKAILISNFHSHTQNARITALIWLFVVIAAATFCQIASAQNNNFTALEVAEKYRTEFAPYNADEDTLKANKSANRGSEKNQRESLAKVKAILNSNGNFADPIISEYFDGYEFPSMTTMDSRVLSQLGETRTKFIKDFLGSNVTGNARNGMIDLTIESTQKICADKSLHPAARLNAVYLMGMLDQVAPIRNPVQLPVPSKAAFESLRKILDSADETAFPPYLRVAALAGIHRHVEIDRAVGGQISDANKQALLQKASTYLDDPKTDDLSYWLKRRAMQLIGLIGDPQSLDRVISVLESEDAGFWLRFDALEAIGKLKLGTDGLANNMKATVAITGFLASSLENESKRIQRSIDTLVYDQMLFADVDLVETGTNYGSNQAAATGRAFSGGGGFGGGGGMGGKGGMSMGGGGGFDMGQEGGMGGALGGSPSAPGGGGFGGRGGGFGGGLGGGFGGQTQNNGPLLELPVYQLNIIRRRIKALAFTGSQILGGETGNDGLAKLVDADGQAFIAKVVKDLNNTLTESNVGIIDLDARKSDDEPITVAEPESVAKQLIKLCKKSSKTLGGYVRAQTGEPEAVPVDPASAAVGAPATPAAADRTDF